MLILASNSSGAFFNQKQKQHQQHTTDKKMRISTIIIVLCLCGFVLANKPSEWTWISGSDTTNQPGSYGVKGLASPDNYPGARQSAVGWFDSLREELWVFGGETSGSARTLIWLRCC